MHDFETLRELFRYNDWARERVLRLAAPCSDAELDRPFEMGEGSLRNTLYHLWAAEYGWLDRWQPQGASPYDAECHGENAVEIGRRHVETAAARDAFLTALGPGGLTRTITYTNSKGVTSTFSFGQMMLHVCNHGVHHRAQALAMLRKLGHLGEWRGLDYIFMKQEADHRAAPRVAVGALRTYLDYGDWGNRELLDRAAALANAALDRPFEMGCGNLRKTLAHIRFAEQWWLENWTHGPGRPFPETEPDISIVELTRLFADTCRQRDRYIGALADDDLLGETAAEPRPGLVKRFPLGVTLIQLCCHGTHHRAQALNMLRHLKADVPGLDYVTMLRAQARGS
jgi:uncharacterized damage-inducible protein DinB